MVLWVISSKNYVHHFQTEAYRCFLLCCSVLQFSPYQSLRHPHLSSSHLNSQLPSTTLSYPESSLTTHLHSGRTNNENTFQALQHSFPATFRPNVLGVLGLVLFFVYINNALDSLNSSGKLYVDDAKLYKQIQTPYDSRALQEDLDSQQEWSQKWMLEFYTMKCKIMHIRRKNLGYTYTMRGEVLTTTTVE